jgi:hypothetical protein
MSSRKMRKADMGDTVVFRADANGLSQYWPHIGHHADVLDVQLKPQLHRQSPRAVYEVRCQECDMVLHPRAEAFTLA